jgi:hypothetical protein
LVSRSRIAANAQRSAWPSIRRKCFSVSTHVVRATLDSALWALDDVGGRQAFVQRFWVNISFMPSRRLRAALSWFRVPGPLEACCSPRRQSAQLSGCEWRLAPLTNIQYFGSILNLAGIRVICCFRFVFMVADSCIVRASKAPLLRIPDLPGRPVDGEHEPDESFALGAGDEVVFESACLIRRHVAEQVRIRHFWMDRAVFRKWH